MQHPTAQPDIHQQGIVTGTIPMKLPRVFGNRPGNGRSIQALPLLAIAAALATVNIAPARGWPIGAAPRTAAGLRATAFASHLDHPRWLLVLPNGDVLVAESNAPPKPKGRWSLRQWARGFMMRRAGAGVPSANHITLLRDTDGDGVAEFQSVLLAGLESPFGMALVGDRLFVANADALLSFPYKAGDSEISAEGTRVLDLPGGPINHHWTKNLLPSADGRRLYVSVGSNSIERVPG
jgi:glucose/arabinose dehydrogenase